MLYCSKHPNSLGRVTSISESACLYTLSRRYHIGESLIPSVRHYLRFIDADEKVASYGFTTKVNVASPLFCRPLTYLKPGSAIKFNQYKKEGCMLLHLIISPDQNLTKNTI